jgi:predicted nuclease of predicted toxin-antitoxin system
VILWVDAQLSPALAPWITKHLGIEAYSVKRLGLRDAADNDIFKAARETSAVIITKDADFVRLVERKGPPPNIIWLTLGNTSNAHLRAVLGRALLSAIDLIECGESLVEISDPRKTHSE